MCGALDVEACNLLVIALFGSNYRYVTDYTKRPILGIFEVTEQHAIEWLNSFALTKEQIEQIEKRVRE